MVARPLVVVARSLSLVVGLGAVLASASPFPSGALAQAPGEDRPPPRTDPATSADAPPPPPPDERSGFDERMSRRGLGPDLQLQGGYGLGVESGVPQFGLGRIRAGLLHVGERWVSSVGAAAIVGGLSDGWAVGGQGDVLHTGSGFVLEAGLSYASGGAALFDLSMGWSVFALEYEWRSDDQARARHALFFKLRIPVGLILFFL